MTEKSRIEFFFQKKPVFLPNRSLLKRFIELLLKKEGRPLIKLNIIFCSDKYLLRINQSYLAHDFFTDIISFDLNGPSLPLEGEIYISIDRVRENAKMLGITFTREIHRVIFHGLLHFCGYKDKSKNHTILMRKKEEQYLKAYFK
jgi:probable rRNA maturation factor